MSTPHGQGGGGRASEPPAPVVPANIAHRSTASPVHQSHATARSDPSTAINQTQNPFISRRLTGQAHTARPARQNMSSPVGGNPPPSAPSAMRKCGPGSVADAIALLEAERAAKRPANASTRSGLASGDAAGAHGGMFVGNMNDGPASWEVERPDFMSPFSVEANAAGMSMEPAHVKREQTSAEMMRPLASENYKAAASTKAPVTDAPWARPRSASMDRSVHGGHRQAHGILSPGAPLAGVRCRACGSQRHLTKECHAPSKDGTVPICPFHDCSVLDPIGPPGHPLDGHRDYTPGDRVKAPLYCDIVMRYKMAIRSLHAAKLRIMLPQMFKELVINRRRKPCCRVVSKELCPINITIKYSVEFCHGEMPVELEGAWPYTKRDATDPAICDKLQDFDELGWKGMPKGELESKSWEDIKSEYDRGIIPPQVHSKHRSIYLRAPYAEVEPQNVYEDGDGQGSLVQEGAVQSQEPAQMDVDIQMLGTLTEKDDANPEQLTALSEPVAVLSTLPEKVDSSSEQVAALSKQVATLSEQVAALHALVEKSNAISEQKKEALCKILDFLA